MRNTKADRIREAAKKFGYHHSNKWFQGILEAETKESFSQQQISQVLGRMVDRQTADNAAVHHACRNFICACRNDLGLVKKILASYENLPANGGEK